MAQTNPMTASIAFQGNIACGGSAALVMKDDGISMFHGNFHDSGFIPYGVAFALVVHTDSGKAFSFVKQGQVNGTVDILANPTLSRDFTWDDTVKNPAIMDAWPDIVKGFDYHWKADVNADAVTLLRDVVAVVARITPIVGQVVSVISPRG
jgi:hypothetical protein